MFLVAEVLIQEGTGLSVSRFLVKRATIPHESAALDEEGEMVLSSDALVVIWYSSDLSF